MEVKHEQVDYHQTQGQEHKHNFKLTLRKQLIIKQGKT